MRHPYYDKVTTSNEIQEQYKKTGRMGYRTIVNSKTCFPPSGRVGLVWRIKNKNNKMKASDPTKVTLFCLNRLEKIRIRTRQQHLANWIKIRTQICTDLKKLKTLKMFNKPLQTVTNKQITLLNY